MNKEINYMLSVLRAELVVIRGHRLWLKGLVGEVTTVESRRDCVVLSEYSSHLRLVINNFEAADRLINLGVNINNIQLTLHEPLYDPYRFDYTGFDLIRKRVNSVKIIEMLCINGEVPIQLLTVDKKHRIDDLQPDWYYYHYRVGDSDLVKVVKYNRFVPLKRLKRMMDENERCDNLSSKYMIINEYEVE